MDGNTDHYEDDYRSDKEVEKGPNISEEAAQTVAHASGIEEEAHVEQQVLPDSVEDGLGIEEAVQSVEHVSGENVHPGSFRIIKHPLDPINCPRLYTPTQ